MTSRTKVALPICLSVLLAPLPASAAGFLVGGGGVPIGLGSGKEDNTFTGLGAGWIGGGWVRVTEDGKLPRLLLGARTGLLGARNTVGDSEIDASFVTTAAYVGLFAPFSPTHAIEFRGGLGWHGMKLGDMEGREDGALIAAGVGAWLLLSDRDSNLDSGFDLVLRPHLDIQWMTTQNIGPATFLVPSVTLTAVL